MRLTTRGRFAVTAMLDLALRGAREPVALCQISARQNISLSYLEQLFGKLRRHQLVASVRGPGGGYRLARSLDQVSIAEILLAVEEPLDATLCAGRENCDEGRRCLTHDLWADLNRRVLDYLGAVTLGQLVVDERVRKVAASQSKRLETRLAGSDQRKRRFIPLRRTA
jgi:Rrf2 family transcriptional regulator, iron-sulfur cluster assembly transcription factor